MSVTTGKHPCESYHRLTLDTLQYSDNLMQPVLKALES